MKACLACIITVVRCITPQLLGESYSAKGLISMEIHNSQTDELIRFSEMHFSVDFSSEPYFWLITLEAIGGEEVGRWDYKRITFDGSEVAYLTSYKALREDPATAPHFQGINDSSALVSLGEVPNYANFELAGPIWLAYCSSVYMARNAKAKELDLASGFLTKDGRNISPPERVSRRAVRSLFKNPPYLPKQITYFNSKTLGTSTTNSFYTVDSTLPWQNLEFPKTSTFITYKRDLLFNEAPPKYPSVVYRMATFEVTPLQNGMEELKALPGLTGINDRRFATDTKEPKEQITYFHKGTFPSMEMVRTNQAYLDEPVMDAPFQIEPLQTETAKRSYFFLIAALALAAPFLIKKIIIKPNN